ncbi:uncharacterized protein BJ171DRAFT_509425 [Polychytrium aggregatum]|uniref:uncharacterized protein n=1 Tax=Polychytrium aggregatum TaxID=110093 RepID=UPI0022FE1FB8|nr:uncharacterized protein BJ171DRAFT_509425 [Polychytrium aggregatum]KAI9203732.1 hypothetical protein BJ171DRAFT_509425 [Polychytrium aggregatum]
MQLALARRYASRAPARPLPTSAMFLVQLCAGLHPTGPGSNLDRAGIRSYSARSPIGEYSSNSLIWFAQFQKSNLPLLSSILCMTPTETIEALDRFVKACEHDRSIPERLNHWERNVLDELTSAVKASLSATDDLRCLCRAALALDFLGQITPDLHRILMSALHSSLGQMRQMRSPLSLDDATALLKVLRIPGADPSLCSDVVDLVRSAVSQINLDGADTEALDIIINFHAAHNLDVADWPAIGRHVLQHLDQFSRPALLSILPCMSRVNICVEPLFGAMLFEHHGSMSPSQAARTIASWKSWCRLGSLLQPGFVGTFTARLWVTVKDCLPAFPTSCLLDALDVFGSLEQTHICAQVEEAVSLRLPTLSRTEQIMLLFAFTIRGKEHPALTQAVLAIENVHGIPPPALARLAYLLFKLEDRSSPTPSMLSAPGQRIRGDLLCILDRELTSFSVQELALCFRLFSDMDLSMYDADALRDRLDRIREYAALMQVDDPEELAQLVELCGSHQGVHADLLRGTKDVAPSMLADVKLDNIRNLLEAGLQTTGVVLPQVRSMVEAIRVEEMDRVSPRQLTKWLESDSELELCGPRFLQAVQISLSSARQRFITPADLIGLLKLFSKHPRYPIGLWQDIVGRLRPKIKNLDPSMLVMLANCLMIIEPIATHDLEVICTALTHERISRVAPALINELLELHLACRPHMRISDADMAQIVAARCSHLDEDGLMRLSKSVARLNLPRRLRYSLYQKLDAWQGAYVSQKPGQPVSSGRFGGRHHQPASNTAQLR